MARGYLLLILHCHLPFVRHPEQEDYLEEDWLHEAVAETYLPLLQMLRRLEDAGAPARIAVSLSPILCEMLADPLLKERTARYMDRRVALGESEAARRRGGPFEAASRFHLEHYRSVRRTYLDECGSDLVAAFARLERNGRIELLGSAATHALLPLVDTQAARRAQIAVGLESFERHFGHRPHGFWLPECAYAPGIEELLADAGLRYFVLETHGVLLAEPRPPRGVFAPLRTPAGPFAFGRDVETSREVWSADGGFPGDAAYREFHRDLGYDEDPDYLRGFVGASGGRRPVGFKYHRVTGRVPLGEKQPYDPEAARRRAREHAARFVRDRVSQVSRVSRIIGGDPAIAAPYDGELFGHWWLEGPWFLEEALRLLGERSEVQCVGPAECLDRLCDGGAPIHEARPAMSSWGDGGYFEVWVNGSNDWMYPRLHEAERTMAQLAERARDAGPDARRAAAQCARELMLAQAGDWAFLISAHTADAYARRRFEDHMERFGRLAQQVAGGRLAADELSEVEARDNPFPWLDPSVYLPRNHD